jgi:hypothetical protein
MLFLAAPAQAQQAVFVHGAGGFGATAWGVGVRLGGEPTLWQGKAWRLDHDWKARIAQWTSHRNPDARSLWDVSAYSTFRLLPASAAEVVPFVEAGLGVQLLSRVKLGVRHLGSAFHFHEHVAAGARFGPGRAYSVALRAEHVSNAHIRTPNDGMNLYGIELQYDWR